MDTHLRLLQRQASTGDPLATQRYINALERALGGVEPLLPITEDPQYGPEAVVPNIYGTQLRCPPYPQPVDYLRVCDEHGNEMAYWSVDEWFPLEGQGDINSSMETIGAVVGALSNNTGVKPRTLVRGYTPVLVFNVSFDGV